MALVSSRRLVLAVVLLADVMDLVDTTVMNVAAPAVRAGLGGGPALLEWLSAGYTLAFGVLLVVGGRLGDRVGRRRMFLVGSAGFTLASAVCALAPTPGVLVAARVVQGGFGALMIPQGLGVLTAVFDESERPRVFAAFGPVMGLSAVLGPIVAGALVAVDPDGLGWRLVFLVNVPLGLATVLGAYRLMPADAGDRAVRIDALGAILVAASCGLLVHPLIQGPESGWPAWTVAALACGVVALGGFVWRQRRAAAPILVPSLLRSRTYLAGLALTVVFFTGVGGLLLVLSLHLQLDLGASPLTAGLALAPVALGIAPAAVVSSRLVRRLGRGALHVALAVEVLGALGIAAVAAGLVGTDGPVALAPPALVLGFGLGLMFGPLFSTVLSGLAPDEVGSASGSLEAVQQVGSALGVAVLGTVYLTTGGAGGLALGCLVVVASAAVSALAVAALPTRAFEPADHREGVLT